MSIAKEDWDKIDFSDLEMNPKEEHYSSEHPSVFLKEDFLDPLGWSQKQLSHHLEIPESRVSAILRGERGISINTALRLEKLFGMSAEFWLRLQLNYDLKKERLTKTTSIENIRPVVFTT